MKESMSASISLNNRLKQGFQDSEYPRKLKVLPWIWDHTDIQWTNIKILFYLKTLGEGITAVPFTLPKQRA